MTTNRERLAKMTNEDLAEFLSSSECSMCVYDEEVDCFGDDCFCGILKWLNQECEDDNNAR